MSNAAAATQERTYYGSIGEGNQSGCEDFHVEGFVPCNGTILVVIPPAKKETKGGIIKTERSLERPSIGRVAAVPPNDPKCPVKVGDWVVTRYMEGHMINFDDRNDLILLHYCDGPDSDIVGFFPDPDFDHDSVERI